MRVILFEIKHIFNWKILLFIAFFTAGYYMLNMSFDLRDAHSNMIAAIYNVNREMVIKYGTTLDKKEFNDFKLSYKRKVSEADAYIKHHKEFTSIGITNYKAFENMNTQKPQYNSLRHKIIFDNQVKLFEVLSAQEAVIVCYNHKNADIWFFFNCFDQNRTINSAQRARINQIIKSGQLNSNISETIFSGYDKLFDEDAQLIFICVLFLLGTVFLSDRRRKVVQIQCSSKTGRGIFKLKVAASIISAFILVTLQLVLFFAIYSQLDVGMFLNVKLMSFANNTFVSWYNPTFLQYILLTVAGVYIISFCAGSTSIILSKCLPNYIILIGALVLASAAFSGFLPGYMLAKLNTIELPQYLTPTFYSVLAGIAIILPLILWHREKKLDICN